MKKRWIAMALAAAMLLSLLTGCGAKQGESQTADGQPQQQQQQTAPKNTKKAEDFYSLWEEICDVQEAEIDLKRPYHGTTLRLTGTVSRTNHTAALSLSLADTDGQDRAWTAMRVIENEIYLNVGELAESTLAFPLTPLRRDEIEELKSTQSAAWMLYQWEGELWEGIPAWEDLLDAFWQDSRADLEPHMKKDGKNGYVLTLKGKDLEQAGGSTAQRLLDQREAYLEGFTEVMDQQNGLRFALPLSNAELFDKLWNRILHQSPAVEEPEMADYDEAAEDTPNEEDFDEDEEEYIPENIDSVPPSVTEAPEEEEPVTAVSFAIGKDDGAYTVSLRHNDEAVFDLTLTPVSDFQTEAPEDVMLFDSYYADIYYLVVLCRDYVEDVLDGTQPEDSYDPALFDDELEGGGELYPLTTRAAEGYEGIELISFLTDGGSAQSVPILTGYESNAVSSEHDDGELITYLTLNGRGWEELVYTLSAESSPEEDVSSEVQDYYGLLVLAAGYQEVEEPSSVAVSGSGQNAAQGFSYQENPYSPVEAKLMVLLRQSDAKSYTALEFTLNLDELTDAQRRQLDELFRYLGIEVPISLQIADIAE